MFSCKGISCFQNRALAAAAKNTRKSENLFLFSFFSDEWRLLHADLRMDRPFDFVLKGFLLIVNLLVVLYRRLACRGVAFVSI